MAMPLRRLGIAFVALLALAAAGFLVWRSAPEFHIDIEASEIQSRLAARLPLRNCALILACLEIANARVTLAEGSDRIGIRADMLASFGTRQMPGVAALSGKPRYVPGNAQIFIDDLRIDELQMQGMSPEVAELVKSRGPALLRGVLQSTPIYTLRGNTLKDDFARFALQQVDVVGGKLRLTLRRPSTANPGGNG
jgi:hypothetical protein